MPVKAPPQRRWLVNSPQIMPITQTKPTKASNAIYIPYGPESSGTPLVSSSVPRGRGRAALAHRRRPPTPRRAPPREHPLVERDLAANASRRAVHLVQEKAQPQPHGEQPYAEKQHVSGRFHPRGYAPGAPCCEELAEPQRRRSQQGVEEKLPRRHARRRPAPAGPARVGRPGRPPAR